jgi:hypothetical protein
MREIVEAVVGEAGRESLTVRAVGEILRADAIFERLPNGRWQAGYIGAARTRSPSQALLTTPS